MKILSFKPLLLSSSLYSREWDVDRSTGCHLMTIVNYISRTAGWDKRSKDLDEEALQKFATAGYLWEHVMSYEDQLEYALSKEASRMELIHRRELMFPGELYWCYQCDDVMPGGRIAEEHAKSRRHTGIYFTLDAINHLLEAVEEWKLTWKSSANVGPQKFDIKKWLAQNQFYCKGVGLSRGYFRTCFVVGDYKTYPLFPEPYEILLEYQERELRNNFSFVVSNARAMEWI